MGHVLLGRFGATGTDSEVIPTIVNQGVPGGRPAIDPRNAALDTRTPAELTAAGAGRVAGNVLARQVIAASGSTADIRTANAAGAAAFRAQAAAEAAGKTAEEQATAAEAAVKKTVELMTAGASPGEAGAAGDKAAAEVIGSNTIYYVAGGLLVAGLLGTLLLSRKRTASRPQPVLAGYNRRRNRKHKRASWIR